MTTNTKHFSPRPLNYLTLISLIWLSLATLARATHPHPINITFAFNPLTNLLDDVSSLAPENSAHSRLGNAYDTAAPASSALQAIIKQMPITFTQSIGDDFRATLSAAVQRALPQRINHHILGKILSSPNFSIHIQTTAEFSDFGTQSRFDAKSMTLYLSLSCFVDEAWSLLYVLANSFSYLSWLTFYNKNSHNQTLVTEHLDLANNALKKDVAILIDMNKKNRFLATDQKTKDYFNAVSDWQPQLQPINSIETCHFINTTMQKNSLTNHSHLVSFTEKSGEDRKSIFAPKETQPYYISNTCPPLFFNKLPPTTPQEKLFALVESFYQKREKLHELFSLTDSQPSKVKLGIFPNYCKAATTAMALDSNYCGEDIRSKPTSRSWM